MPDMTIVIGERSFAVACQDGEEGYLSAAAELLDREAKVLASTGNRLTQDRMLLMAGLMLADKSISAEEELRALDRRLAQQTQLLDEMQARQAAEPKTVEVVKEVVPDAALARLNALADKAEDLAARTRARAAG
tara:strand:- start:952 stop:1353 length:402 start_codon:yes stop_codon:yes gene_type:complete